MELETALEELRSAEEELLQQHEELTSAYEALEVERQRYQDLFEFAPDGYLVTDPRGIIREANHAAATLFNLSQQFLLGKPLALFVTAEERGAFRSELSRLSQVDRVQEWEVHLQPHKGAPVDADITATVIHDRTGKLVGLRWLLRDITERKRMEQALLNEERFRLLFEHSPDGIILTDPHHPSGIWPIVACNDAACRMNGYTREELIGQSIDLLHTEYRDQEAYAARLAWLRHEGTVQHEGIHRRKDGRVFPIESSVSLITLAGQELILGIDRDITERKRMEEALYETNQMLQAVIQASPLAIIALDLPGNVTLWNPAAERIFGWSEHEVLGYPNPIVPEDQRDEFQAKHARTLQGAIFTELELQRRRKDGSLIDVSISSGPLRAVDGTIRGSMGVIVDITERKRMEEALAWREALLWAMASAAPVGLFVVDNRTDAILYFNHRFCEMWGIQHLEERMQRGELKNNDILPDCLSLVQDVPAFIESCKPLQSEENRIDLEDELRFVDGRIIRRFSTQIRDEHDRYFGRFYIFNDITERKRMEEALRSAHDELEMRVQERTAALTKANAALEAEIAERKRAERALRESKAKLRLIIQQLPAHIWTTDTDLRVSSVMGGTLTHIGIDPNQFIGKPLGELLETSDHAALLAHRRALEGESAGYELNVMDRLYEARVEPLRDGQGQIVGCVGLALDVTERKQTEEALQKAHDELEMRVAERTAQLVEANRILAEEILERERVEEALRESEMRFRAIFEGAAIGIGLVDMRGHTVESNPVLQEMLGYSAEELRSMVFTHTTHPKHVAADWDLFKELLAGKRESYQLEKRYIRKDGQVMWGQLTVSLARSAAGEPQFAIGMVEDITERKRVAAELAKAQRRLAEIQEAERLHLARELHDCTVQQLLGISYQLGALRRNAGARQHRLDAPGDAGLVTTLDVVYKEVLGVVAQLRGLIGTLRPAGLEELGLTTALEGYVARLQREWGPELPEIELHLDKSGTALPKPAALCLFRAAQEALRNALQHAHAQHITLRLRLLSSAVLLSVSDDGCGFHVPARLSELAQTDHFGLVGMAERVALAGGQLTICSQPRAGTRVMIRIPLSETELDDERDDSSTTGR